MKNYLVKVASGYNILDELSRFGQVEYVLKVITYKRTMLS